MIKYWVVLILIIFYSCKQTANKDSYTYFGGQIVNPKVDYIYLIKDGIAIDSSLLDSENKFLMKFILEKEGLFHFKHGNEFQYIHIEPTDSILVKLNTWDFDESIVFTGKGAEKNNFLINLYLINELEEKNFYPFYYFDSKEFSKKVDSTILSKENLLSKFKKNNQNISEGFLNLAKASIYLPTYRKKENFTYGHKMLLNLPDYPEVEEDFYQYRKQINLNDSTLIYFHPYQNYLNSFIYYKASKIKEKDSLSQRFSFIALQLIDKEFKNETIKNLMLKQTLVESFLNNTPCMFENSALAFYNKTSNNKVDKEKILKLNNDSNSLTNKKILDDFTLINSKNQQFNIYNFIKNRNTVIYFWSTNSMSVEYLISRIHYLETQFPSILFIGINTDNSQKSIEKSVNFPLKNQFFLPNNSLGKKHINSNFPRAILINKDRIVENSFTFLASKHFNHQIADLEKY